MSKYSKHKAAAIEFVRYMTSPAVEKFDAITNSNVPTIPSVAKDKAVVQGQPVPEARDRERRARDAARRSSSKTHYNEGSKDIYQGINQILNGAAAKSVLPAIQSQLNATRCKLDAA